MNRDIPYSRPPITGKELGFIQRVIEDGRSIAGNGLFSQRCEDWFERQQGIHRAFLVPSCTAALEMAALLLNIQPGDEVIMPSFTFVSTANAFVLRGAHPVFIDIRPDTLNMNEQLLEEAITDKTRAIVPVHYAGVSCTMEPILDIADRHYIPVVEDSAQGIGATYKGKALGTLGTFGCFSFHETKNISCGEGGAFLVNDEHFVERTEIIQEKGTSRSKFFRREVDKYTWIDLGSSYLVSEMQAAFLWAQLESIEQIIAQRLDIWNTYREAFSNLELEGKVQLPVVPEECQHNGHIFYLKLHSKEQRDALIKFLRHAGIHAIFHYIPLHSSPAGERYGRFHGEDRFTTDLSNRIVRLPLYYGLSKIDQTYIIDHVDRFFSATPVC